MAETETLTKLWLNVIILLKRTEGGFLLGYIINLKKGYRY